MLFHVLLGVASSFTSGFMIFWFYFFILTSFNTIFSDLFLRNGIQKLIPFLVYICSFEVFARMLKAYPYIPWEVSKYVLISSFIILLLINKIKNPSRIGLLIFLLLIPGVLIDLSSKVDLQLLINNLFGITSLAFLLIIVKDYSITKQEFDSILRLLWYSTIPTLIYVIIRTPELTLLNFTLNANFQATAGFGSNQVASILGIGMFLSFYAWMNKHLFSGNHSLDGLFIGLFAYQGFLTFSRGGMVVVLVAIVIYYILFRSSNFYLDIIKIRKLRPFFFFSSAIIIILITFFFIQNISDGNITKRYSGDTTATLSGAQIKTINTITTGRYDLFLEDLNLWYKNFIFGTGIGASKFLRGNGLNGISPHTEISRLLAEHGIFGLIIILIMFGLVYRSYRINKLSSYRGILVCLGLIAIGTAMHSAMRTFITPIFFCLCTMRIIEDNIDDDGMI
tara:strand:+ start:18 stop:1370 length:1353 start_codon:yes stop_codon:yes gene_type:complete